MRTKRHVKTFLLAAVVMTSVVAHQAVRGQSAVGLLERVAALEKRLENEERARTQERQSLEYQLRYQNRKLVEYEQTFRDLEFKLQYLFDEDGQIGTPYTKITSVSDFRLWLGDCDEPSESGRIMVSADAANAKLWVCHERRWRVISLDSQPH